MYLYPSFTPSRVSLGLQTDCHVGKMITRRREAQCLPLLSHSARHLFRMRCFPFTFPPFESHEYRLDSTLERLTRSSKCRCACSQANEESKHLQAFAHKQRLSCFTVTREALTREAMNETVISGSVFPSISHIQINSLLPLSRLLLEMQGAKYSSILASATEAACFVLSNSETSADDLRSLLSFFPISDRPRSTVTH